MTLLSRKPVFIVVLAVLFTTLFSWFRINSYCILLLLIGGLWIAGPGKSLSKAFTNKFFLAYFVYCLIEAAGLFYTHNPVRGQNLVAKDATLVAMAFVLCACPFAVESEYKKLMTAYCVLVLLSSLFCLSKAALIYLQSHDPAVFFYHRLTVPISQNAVFYSVYVLFAMLFLLSPDGDPEFIHLTRKTRKWLRILSIVFFLIMIFLLSSKLILVISLIMIANFFLKRYYSIWSNKVLLLSALGALCLVVAIATIDNPVRKRFGRMIESDFRIPPRNEINAVTDFNDLNLRLLEWQFAVEILREHHAWLFGVSPGDSQDLLDQKYIATHMYIGIPEDGPERKIRGYLGYNFHNQYIETLVHSGIIGLASLLSILGLLTGIALRWKTKEARFTVVTLVVFFLFEAPLTMQQGVFLFVFFPLVLLYSPRKNGTANAIN